MNPACVPGAAPGLSRTAVPGRFFWCAAMGLLVIGGGLCGRAGYLRAKAQLAGHLIRQAWGQTLDTGEPQAPWPWADTHPIGRLLIPRLGYDEIVLEGASPRNLAFGPARMMSGAAMGAPGNLILAGHRTSWFRPLEKVALGDGLWLEWRDAASGKGRRRGYRVAEIRVIDPDDPSFLAPTADEVLTLITCYPFGPSPSSPQRYVVRAEAIRPGRLQRMAIVGQGQSPSSTRSARPDHLSRAGTSTAVAPAGTSDKTTDWAPIVAWAPTSSRRDTDSNQSGLAGWTWHTFLVLIRSSFPCGRPRR